MPDRDSDNKPMPFYKIIEEEFVSIHDGLLEEDKESGENPENAESASERHRKPLIAEFNAYESLRDKLENEGLEPRELDKRLAPELFRMIHGLKPGHSALCLSGGGIRSATFALGIIQGLARCGLLDKFDYLSTVSGGGYIGSWLTAWIYHASENAQAKDGLKKVMGDLKGKPQSPWEPEPREIRHLREYSNYLSPRPGFLSADTWSLAATYLRNLLINWTVFIPLLAAVLLLPRLYVAVVVTGPRCELLKWQAFGLGYLACAIAIFYMGVNRPSSKVEGDFWKSRQGQGSFLRWCLLPLSISGVCLTTFWAWYCASGGGISGAKAPGLPTFLLLGALLHIAGWVGYAFRLGKSIRWEPLIVLISGALGGWLIWLAAAKILPPSPFQSFCTSDAELYVCFAFPLFLAAFALAAVVLNGLISRYTSEDDREWWARAGAWLLIVMVIWSVVSSLVIFGPIALYAGPWIAASTGGVTGIVSVLLGWSAKLPAVRKDGQGGVWQSMLVNSGLTLAALVFLAVLIAALSLGTSYFLDWTFPPACGIKAQCLSTTSWRSSGGAIMHMWIVRHTRWEDILLLLIALLIVGLFISRAVSINRFSLHAMYRSRLVRAYLGASRKRREPNLFTGFDPDDNIQMCELPPNKPATEAVDKTDVRKARLFHVVNVALNLVHGKSLAWQQRKAETFTVSPLHCGNYRLGYRKSAEYAKDKDRFFGSANDPAITLGTAMTISGAAVSPNMGYHSSPVITFLLALFNVRLGCCLGNPGLAGNTTYRQSQPKWALSTLVSEAFGLSDDRSPYVYLSDGGHFENLGLYEMVLRRCRFIVVSDATCDPDCAFDDLGGAVRKIRIDLGIPIEFESKIHIRSRHDKEEGLKRKHCAIGRIRYSVVDAPARDGERVEDGILFYFKPVICGDEPGDVLQYAKANLEFPHESTGDQFFSESQFESYRMLGLHFIEDICKERVFPGFDGFRQAVDDYLAEDKSASPAPVPDGKGLA